jgi:hypothetical protein
MRRQSRLGGLFVLVLVGLIVPVLATAPAQAASAGSMIVAASGTPSGVSKGDPFTVSKDAGLAAQLGTRQGNSTNAFCLEPGYAQVFATDGGGHLHTSFPGLTITAQTFTILLHRGIVEPNTRAIWFYRWDNDSRGFDYFTSFANENCLIQEERNPLSAQNFPINNPVSVSVCFVSWEVGQVLCGWVGTVNRIS